MKPRIFHLISVTAMAWFLMIGPVQAQSNATVQLRAIDDATIDSGHQSTNTGSSINTYVGDRAPAGGGTCLSFYQFDMSVVPYNAEIINAELWLCKHEKYGAFQQNLTLDAHLITTPGWDESTVTYNNPPGYSTNPSATSTEWFEPSGWSVWNITGDVGAIRPSQNLIGWALKMNPPVPWVWLNFYSHEQVPMPDYRPMLEITYSTVVATEPTSWSEVKSLYR